MHCTKANATNLGILKTTNDNQKEEVSLEDGEVPDGRDGGGDDDDEGKEGRVLLETPYIVTELCTEGTMEDVMSGTFFATHRGREQFVAKALYYVLTALRYLHREKNVLHRDMCVR